jgi:hypothetical protein
MQLSEERIEKIRDQREKERSQQYAIMNGERESVQWEEAIYKKLKSLQSSVGLFYSVNKYYLTLCQKFGHTNQVEDSD